MTHAILTCSEYFTELAINEIRRYHPDINILCKLSPKHLLLQAPISFEQLSKIWRHKLPIYLHHLFPVHRRFFLSGTDRDIRKIYKQVRKFTSETFATQVQIVGDVPYHRGDIMWHIHNEKMPTMQAAKVHERVLSLLITCVDNRWCAYMGISWATQNISSWAGGQIRFDEPVPNRAGLKILEALNAFEIRLRENDRVLDLGAAPGAWTEVMRRRGLCITAVAPKAMYDWLQDDRQVEVVSSTAEAYLEQCRATYDLILNDMILDAQDSARLMLDYAQFLREEGIAIMTLKLRERNRRRVMDHALRILRKAYKIIRIRQLVNNKREVTLFLRKKH